MTGDLEESKEILKAIDESALAPDIYSFNSVLKLGA